MQLCKIYCILLYPVIIVCNFKTKMEINFNQASENIMPPENSSYEVKNEENSLEAAENSEKTEQNAVIEPKREENTSFSSKTPIDVDNFEQILSKFIEKYESARNNISTLEKEEKADTDEDFSRLFPNRSLEKELENPDFKLFCNYKGKNTYGKCFSDFLAICDSIERKARQKVLVSLANKESSVGSLSSEEKPACDFFTKEQVLKMSSEQIKRNCAKIRESQQKW